MMMIYNNVQEFTDAEDIGVCVELDMSVDIPNRYDDVQELADEEYVGVGVELVVDKLKEVRKQLFLFL